LEAADVGNVVCVVVTAENATDWVSATSAATAAIALAAPLPSTPLPEVSVGAVDPTPAVPLPVVSGEAAERRRLAAEAAAEAAATGSVSLGGSTIDVESRQEGAVKLTCPDTAPCRGTLTLTVKTRTRRGKKKYAETQTIATATFSISAGNSETVRLALTGTGRALLSAARGHLSANLTIVDALPSASKTRTRIVHLAQQETAAARGKE
jgi:hypothetical protein